MNSQLFQNPVLWLIIFDIMAILSSCYVISNPGVKSRFFALPVIIQKLYVILMVGPVLIIPLLSQPGFLPNFKAIAIAGALLCASAVLIWILAFLKIGFIPSIKTRASLITGGVYGLVRNPIYLGIVLAAFGTALLFHAMYALMYAPVITLLFSILSVIEEKGLLEEYKSEYREYMSRVQYRLIPFLF